ncbi:MAG: helix-turn-helix domain-containing protein [Patescibacteria group bacterium]|nr:helix-turn-helix domain-containing protein [Patescibacteria group bacterium]
MKELEILPLELRKLGLTKKEVAVYLSALELGYASAQEIARQSKISRPTAYKIIKSLEEKGLISESKDRQKRYFTAESPDKFLGIIKRQKREIEEKEREFIRIIAALRDKYHLGDKREIKTYKNKFGLKTLFNDLLTTQNREIYVLANDEKIWPKEKRQIVYRKIKKRLGKIQIIEKRLPIPFQGVVIIYDKAIILSGKLKGIMIENKIIVGLIKELFSRE